MELDKGKSEMNKPTGLAAFKRKSEIIENESTSSLGKFPERKRGKGETVSLTVRVTREQWEKLHQLAVAEGVSIQNLCMVGLSGVFKEKGLPNFVL